MKNKDKPILGKAKRYFTTCCSRIYSICGWICGWIRYWIPDWICDGIRDGICWIYDGICWIYDWIRHLSRIKKVTATIFTPVQLRVVEKMLPELTSKLQRLLMSRNGVKLAIDRVCEPSKPEASKPLLVMCVNASRLGTDVDNALQHVTCTQESMVVVLHYKDEHALPSQSSDKLLIGPSYQALGGISDIAFTSENGMYNCEMNERGIEKIADFIIQRNLY